MRPPVSLSTAVSFPSVADQAALRQRLKSCNWNLESLTDGERWRYHAYDYAFRRVRMGMADRHYPLDRDGKWFNENLVVAAEALYRPPSKPPARRLNTWDPGYFASYD